MKTNNPLILFTSSLLLISFAYGFLTLKFHIFPYPIIRKAEIGYEAIMKKVKGEREWFYQPAPTSPKIQNNSDEKGLNLVTRVAKDNRLAVELRDMSGKIIHSWHVDWFDNWPDGTDHVPAWALPKSRPGTHVHGAVLTPDKGLIFNFEHCGMVKMDYSGNILWRMPLNTHHCIFPFRGNYWACADMESDLIRRSGSFSPQQQEQFIIEFNSEGKILRKIGMVDLLLKNGLKGLLTARGELDVQKGGTVSGDFLHLNNVEIFSEDLQEGFFKHGDIMVSLRNISTIIVFDPRTEKIKFRSTGTVNHQHDPDFVDGNTISVYDNNPFSLNGEKPYSRIVEIKTPSGEQRVIYKGTESQPFYSDIMGKHQWLPNGNLLITESKRGRAFEVTPKGKIVWEFRNDIGDGLVGLVDQVERLSPEMSELFQKQQAGN